MPERERWWSEAVARYGVWGEERAGWSGITVRTVRETLNAWPSRFEAAGLPRPLHVHDVTPKLVLAWKANPMGPGRLGKPRRLRQTTAAEQLAVLGRFVKWAGSKLPEDYPVLFRLPRGDPRPKDWRDTTTLDQLYLACETDAERLLVAALGWAGLRRGGLHDLLVGDVDLNVAHPTATVRMKGGRRVNLPLASGVVNALRPFVVGRSPDARVWPYENRCSTRAILHRICDRAGVPRTYPHALRATFGHILRFERGVEPTVIQQLYGHRDLKTTRIYIGADLSDMRAAVETFDRPRALSKPPIALGV